MENIINGIKNNQLFYQQDRRVPLTNLTIVFEGAGEQQESEELANLARITAKMLFRGTEKLSRLEIAQKFELMGVDISAHVSETNFTISISLFTRNLNEALSFIKEIILDASFPESEIELLKIQMKNKLEASLQDSETVLSAAHKFVIYNGKRFGKIGSIKSLEAIKRNDLINYFNKVKSAQKIYFTAISDLSNSEILQQLQIFILDRKMDGFALLPDEKFQIFNNPTVYIFDSPNSSNDRLMWSHEGINIFDERRFAINLILDALGSFEGFLFERLRNQKGWCYGAYAFNIAGTINNGKIGYYADPSSETSKDLIPELFLLLRMFQNENDFIEKLKLRNNTFKNRYAYQLDLKYKLMREILFCKYGIPILSKEEYFAKIDEVTFEKANQVISEIFDLNKLLMIFYGDANRITKIVEHTIIGAEIKILQPNILIQ